MATAEQYANWIVNNQDKQGTPEFETVANAYKIARGGQPQAPKPEPTVPIEESIVPTDEALAANQAPVPEDKGFFEQAGDIAEGVYEAGKTMVTAPFAALASGIGSLDTILNQIKSGEIGTQEAADKVKAEAERLAAEYTYAPRTETGQEILKTVSEVTEPLIAVAPQLQQVGMATRGAGVGARMAAKEIPKVLEPEIDLAKSAVAYAKPRIDRITETIKRRKELPIEEVSPEQQQTVQSVKGAISDLDESLKSEGVKVIEPKAEPMAGQKSWLFSYEGPAKRKVREAIEKGGEPANVTAGYVMDGAGNIKTLPKAKEAIKYGFDSGVIASAQAASPTDKKVFRQMVDILDQGLKSKEYSAKNRPSQALGQSLYKRFDVAKKLNEQAATEIDTAANSLKGRKVDLSQPIEEFMTLIEDLGVVFDENGNPLFTGPEVDIPQSMQSTVTKIINRAKYVGAKGDAHAAHKMKRFIDDNVSYGGKGAEGLKGYTESIVKKLRASIDDQLDSNFPDYAKANEKYADSISAMDSFADIAGKKIMKVTPKNAKKSFGVLARRLLSNVQSRGPLMDSIELLEELGSKYGAKFDDNIYSQAIFVEELERMFGPSATTSLYGELAKAAGTVAMGDTKTGAIGAVKAVLKPGADQEQAIKAIRAFLAESTKGSK